MGSNLGILLESQIDKANQRTVFFFFFLFPKFPCEDFTQLSTVSCEESVVVNKP